MKKIFSVIALSLIGIASAFSDCGPTPPPPTNLRLTAVTPYMIRINIDPLIGSQVGFQAWRMQDGYETDFHAVNNYPTTSFRDLQKLLPFGVFCYKVRAYDACGHFSVFSDVVDVDALTGPMPNQDTPAAPFGLTATIVTGPAPLGPHVQLNWTAGYFITEPDGSTQNFTIQRSTDQVTWRNLNQLPTTRLNDLTAVIGTTYYYRVYGQNPFYWGMPSAFSEVVSITP